ncbi:MAG: cyanophycinase [Cytophagales bacterium]|nr:cyanophycinase [Armatimonadota bacterium]
MIHGGGSTAPETTRALITRAGGPDARILVLAQTSEDAAAKSKGSLDWLRQNGARNVAAPLVVKPSDSAGIAEALTLLETASGVWIPGGNQNRLMELFARTPIPAAVRALYQRGGAVGGTSAGASLMGEWMPTGDGDLEKLSQDSMTAAPGLGLLPGILVDSHFLARQRPQRLLGMVLSHPQRIGLGVDEKGWVEVDGTAGTITVREGQAMVVRALSPVRRDKEGRLGAADIRLRVLLPGDTVRFAEIGGKGQSR